jgi:hypothetical protein
MVLDGEQVVDPETGRNLCTVWVYIIGGKRSMVIHTYHPPIQELYTGQIITMNHLFYPIFHDISELPFSKIEITHTEKELNQKELKRAIAIKQQLEREGKSIYNKPF